MRGGKVKNKEAANDLEFFGGAPKDWSEAISEESKDLEIETDNWDTVMLFLRVQTQWRIGLSGATGLDYSAVFQTMDRLKVSDPDGIVFEGLQIMECSALKSMSTKV